jgi:hypothetical protein
LTHPSGTIAALPSLEKVANTNTKYNVSQDVALNLEETVVKYEAQRHDSRLWRENSYPYAKNITFGPSDFGVRPLVRTDPSPPLAGRGHGETNAG